YFAQENFTASANCLEKYIAYEQEASSTLKNALLTQMNNASSTGNQGLYESSFAKFDKLFPGDPQTSKALFIQALMHKEQGKSKEAFDNLCFIKEGYPELAEDKAFIFEYAVLALDNGEFNESYNSIAGYIDIATDVERQSASKILLASAVHKHNTPAENPSYNQSIYFNDLRFVASYKQEFSEEESDYFALIFAKAQFDMGMYEETVHYLNDTILSDSSNVSDQMLSKAHFLQGRCFLDGRVDPEASNIHLEKSLELDPKQPGALEIKLQIYNNYISLSANEDNAMLESAANHLFTVVQEAPEKVSQENVLWLANHFFSKSKIAHTDSTVVNTLLENADFCFSSLLTEGDSYVAINEDTLFLELETLKYSKVLQERVLLDKKLALIKNLIHSQKTSPSYDWQYKDEALYELASTYKELGQVSNAVDTFSVICNSGSGFNSAVSAKALFETTKIKFGTIAKKNRTIESQEIISLLENLKTLQIRKNPSSEPIHLESALEYAQIRKELSNPEEQVDKYLFFLNRILEDYKNDEDLSTKAYHLSLAQDASRQNMYNNYIQYIEAEQVRMKGVMHQNSGEAEPMRESFGIAKELLEEINQSEACNKQLKTRVLRSLDLIQKDLTH
ncbi:hypothetical protein COB21_02705, partial [Candidatus Aerophobetes bacterium]